MPILLHIRHMNFDLQGEDDGEPEYHQLFEYVFVVSLKEESKGKLTTEMTYTFPPVSERGGTKYSLLDIIGAIVMNLILVSWLVNFYFLEDIVALACFFFLSFFFFFFSSFHFFSFFSFKVEKKKKSGPGYEARRCYLF